MWIRGLGATIAVMAMALACAACSGDDLVAEPSPDASQPAESATLAPIVAPSEAAADEPVPQISVAVTTPPPDAAGSGGGSGGTVNVDGSVTSASASYASQLVSLANGARADAGVGALKVNSCAQKAAVARAARALVKAHLEHEPLPHCGSGWTGENLARNYGSPADMHAAWMNSPGHRKNILLPQFTGIGVGCVAYSKSDPQRVATRADDVGGHVCSQVFVG